MAELVAWVLPHRGLWVPLVSFSTLGLCRGGVGGVRSADSVIGVEKFAAGGPAHRRFDTAVAELVESAGLALPRELDGPVPNSAVAEWVKTASGLSKEGLSGFTGPASLAAVRLCRGGVGDLANSNRLDSAVAESAMRIQLGRALLD